MKTPDSGLSRPKIVAKALIWFQVLLLLVSGTVGLAVAVLDIFVNDVQNILPFFKDSQSIVLIVASSLALSLGIERFLIFDDIHAKLDRISEHAELEGIHAKLDQISERTESQEIYSKALERRYPMIDAFFRRAEDNSDFYSLAIKYGLRPFAKSLDEKTIRVDTVNETQQLWRECILETSSWRAASYARYVWGSQMHFGDHVSTLIQDLKIKENGSIERVFIVDSPEEYNSLLPVMRKQKKMGIRVHWILREDIEKNSRQEIDGNGVNGSWDFALAAGKTNWVFCFELDEERRITGSSLTIDKDVIEKAVDTLNRLVHMAKPL